MTMQRSQHNVKEQLLKAAQSLILEKGFNATSIDEICKTAKVTKGSFFHYFKSKDALGEAVIEYYWFGQKHMIGSAPFLKIKDPLDRVLGMIDFFISVMKNPKFPKSCVVGNIAQEQAKTNPRLRSACAENFLYWSDFFKKELDAAVKKYIPRKKARIDTKEMANYFITIIQGSFILIKALEKNSIGGQNLKHFKRYVQGLFEANEGLST